jgi:Domain of unknown function (DUF6457)
VPESGKEWIAKFAQGVGVPAPDEDQVERLLKLAAVAAHSSERIAAPIACWIAGTAGLNLDEAIALAEAQDD